MQSTTEYSLYIGVIGSGIVGSPVARCISTMGTTGPCFRNAQYTKERERGERKIYIQRERKREGKHFEKYIRMELPLFNL